MKTMNPERAEMLLKLSQAEVNRRFKMYEHLASMDYTAQKQG
ncbi:MAG: hypothetical protein PHO30_00710 [Candidatus Omnitrophica bacterium]|nr:hypothetical protein [Candidatus Omnitrophota bacterium]